MKIVELESMTVALDRDFSPNPGVAGRWVSEPHSASAASLVWDSCSLFNLYPERIANYNL